MATLISVGDQTYGYKIAISTDNGESWSYSAPDNLPGSPKCIAYNNLDTFVIGGKTTHHLSYSTDNGLTWTGCGQVFGSGLNASIYDIKWNGTLFIGVGNNYNSGYLGIATSPDGITWTAVQNSQKTGIDDDAVCYTVETYQDTILVSCTIAGQLGIAISTDNGSTWQGHVLQTKADDVNDPAWFNAYVLSNGPYNPLATNGTTIITTGGSPRHNVFAYGNTLVDGIPPEDWNYGYSGIGQVKLLSSNSSQFVDTTGYINDGVHTTAVALTKYPAGNTGCSNIIWNGTEFISTLSSWDSNSIGWIATTQDGSLWTNYFETISSLPGQMSSIVKFKKINTRYFICGSGGSGNINIAWSNTLSSNWQLGTAPDLSMNTIYDIAGSVEETLGPTCVFSVQPETITDACIYGKPFSYSLVNPYATGS